MTLGLDASGSPAVSVVNMSLESTRSPFMILARSAVISWSAGPPSSAWPRSGNPLGVLMDVLPYYIDMGMLRATSAYGVHRVAAYPPRWLRHHKLHCTSRLEA